MLTKTQSNWNFQKLLLWIQTNTDTLENSLTVSYKVKDTLPYDSVIPFLNIYWRKTKTYVYTKTCIQMFITTIFIITQIWKEPKCPSTDKLDRPWCVLTMEYYWAIKSDETLACENMGGSQRHYVKWKKPDSKSYILYDSIYTLFWKRQNYETREQTDQGFAGNWGWAEGLTTKKQHKGIWRGNETVSELHCASVKTNRTKNQMSKFYWM